jgi:hypothetical protein
VRLATLNLLNGVSLQDRTVAPARLAQAVRLLRADVLGLQEVDRGQPRSHGADLTAAVAAATGAQHWRFVPALVGTPGGSWRAATDEDDETTGPAYGIGPSRAGRSGPGTSRACPPLPSAHPSCCPARGG